MTQAIIDFRSRPALLHDFYGATPGTSAFETARWLNRRTGSLQDDHFVRSLSLSGYVEEIRESGITHAVLVGRDTPGLRIPNERIRQLVESDPALIGLGSVDPQTHGPIAAAEEAERAMTQLGLRGINIEPGFGEPALLPDDPVYFPVYEVCQAHGLPVCLMSGPTTPDLAFNDPAAVGRIARRFPKLNIVCYHGFYPRMDEIIGVAFRYENVYLVPDMYLFAPGGRRYADAAAAVLQDQFLFATSYPFRAMKQTLDDFISLGFPATVLEKLLFGNAARLLKLEVPAS